MAVRVYAVDLIDRAGPHGAAGTNVLSYVR